MRKIDKMYLKTKYLSLKGVFIFLLVLVWAVTAEASQLYFSESQEEKLESKYVLLVDNVEKLAGLKVIVRYPVENMKYTGSRKTNRTSGFMHVINDKNPGKLIVVMASARGITGDDLPLIELMFEKTHERKGGRLTIVLCQLMDEDLKNITCSLNETE